MSTPRFALLIGSNRYQYCRSLKTAEYDAEQVLQFLTGPGRGGFDGASSRLLRSPTLADVQAELDLACETVGNMGTLLVYISGHGLLNRQGQLHLAFSDTDPEKTALTALSLTKVGEIISERAVNASILILDLCYSGAHAKAASEIALRQLYQREEEPPIGHFILASSGADEVSVENPGGGRFTQLLLEEAERLGRERPFERTLSVAALAASVVSATGRVPGQRACWTGITVSEDVAICANPYWDPDARRADTALRLRDVSAAVCEKFAPEARVFARAMSHVGSGAVWALVASNVILSSCALGDSDATATLVARMVESACQRVQAYGASQDSEQLIATLEAAMIALGRCQSLHTQDGDIVTFRLAEHAGPRAEAIRAWRVSRGWLIPEDGPAAIALAAIRFWDVLGQTAMLAAAADAMGMYTERAALVREILEALRAHPSLYRVEWAGQYPDIAAVLGSVQADDPPLVKTIAQRLLETYFDSAAASRAPAPASLDPGALGRRLANKYSQVTEPAPASEDTVDEGPALFLFMLVHLLDNPFELSAVLARIDRQTAMQNFYLYTPRTFEAQFVRIMHECDVRTWLRRSPESVVKMVDDFRKGFAAMCSQEGLDAARAVTASIAAGRHYRNRCGFWVFDALRRRGAPQVSQTALSLRSTKAV